MEKKQKNRVVFVLVLTGTFSLFAVAVGLILHHTKHIDSQQSQRRNL